MHRNINKPVTLFEEVFMIFDYIRYCYIQKFVHSILFFIENCGKMEGLEAEWANISNDPDAMDVYKQRAEEENKTEIVLSTKSQLHKARTIRSEMQKLVS